MLQIKYFRTFFIPINISERASSEHLHTRTHTHTGLHPHTLALLVLLLLLHIIPLPLLKISPFFPSTQDRHVTRNGDTEPVVDPSQDYMLMLGYENATHTVLRFRRKLDTCDASHDIAITVSTVDV